VKTFNGNFIQTFIVNALNENDAASIQMAPKVLFKNNVEGNLAYIKSKSIILFSTITYLKKQHGANCWCKGHNESVSEIIQKA